MHRSVYRSFHFQSSLDIHDFLAPSINGDTCGFVIMQAANCSTRNFVMFTGLSAIHLASKRRAFAALEICYCASAPS